jgi:hypothetical protein
MKKNIPAFLADEYLESIQPVSPAESDPYFYTALKARMEKEASGPGWNFPVKPAFLVTMLSFFLLINVFFLVTQVRQKNRNNTSTTTSIRQSASGYNLFVTSSF